jgi:DnaJ-class molecular chaperone
MKKDCYFILDLTPEATTEEIRSAYRRLASELHPDLSGFGREQFLEAQEAYSVLSDPMRRAVYDREAEDTPVRRTALARRAETVIRRSHSAEPLTAAQPGGGFEEISLLRSFETFHPSFSEMFDRLWSNFELVTRPKAEQLESLTVDVLLSPRQAFMGGQIRILVPARVTCPTCRGRGSVGSYECCRCEGNGALTDEYPVTVSYPAGLQQDYIMRLPLDRFGIENFYLTVRFRPTEAIS